MNDKTNSDAVIDRPPKKKAVFVNYVLAITVSLCVVCGILLAAASSGGGIATPTTEADLMLIIKSTANAAQTQTMASTQLSLITPASTVTQLIYVGTPTMLPPVDLVATFTLEPTWTPFVLPTQNNNNNSGGGVCSCRGDIYNCDTFSFQSSAQACFNYCVSRGVGDIHKLDQDNDRVACENLP